MSARFILGISALTLIVAAPLAASAQGGVTVIGGGVAYDCYEAVEYGRVQPSQAIALCDIALETEHLRPKDRAATFTNRGILYMRQGNNMRALSDYRKTIALMPELKEAQVNLGAALYNLKRYTEAMTALNKGIEVEDPDAKAVGHYNRGLTHEKLGYIQSAYADFRRALEIKPEFVQASKQIARFTVVPAGG